VTDTQRGVSAFVGAMQGVIARMQPRDRWIEMGRILEDYALEIVDSVHSADGLPLRFKVGRYAVMRHLTLPLDFATVTPDGATTTRDPADPSGFVTPPLEGGHAQYTGDGRHWHHVLTPRQLDTLVPGDVVEVHWMTNYADPIVAGVFVSSSLLPGALALGLVGEGTP
jgi:hypothetical protein